MDAIESINEENIDNTAKDLLESNCDDNELLRFNSMILNSDHNEINEDNNSNMYKPVLTPPEIVYTNSDQGIPSAQTSYNNLQSIYDEPNYEDDDSSKLNNNFEENKLSEKTHDSKNNEDEKIQGTQIPETQIDLNLHLSESTYVSNNSYSIIEGKDKFILSDNLNPVEKLLAVANMQDLKENPKPLENTESTITDAQFDNINIINDKETIDSLITFDHHPHKSNSEIIIQPLSNIKVPTVKSFIRKLSTMNKDPSCEFIQEEFIVTNGVKKSLNRKKIINNKNGKKELAKNKVDTKIVKNQDKKEKLNDSIANITFESAPKTKTIIRKNKVVEVVQITKEFTYRDIVDEFDTIVSTELISDSVNNQLISKREETVRLSEKTEKKNLFNDNDNKVKVNLNSNISNDYARLSDSEGSVFINGDEDVMINEESESKINLTKKDFKIKPKRKSNIRISISSEKKRKSSSDIESFNKLYEELYDYEDQDNDIKINDDSINEKLKKDDYIDLTKVIKIDKKKNINYDLRDAKIVIEKLKLDKYKFPVNMNKLLEDNVIKNNVNLKKTCKKRRISQESGSVIAIEDAIKYNKTKIRNKRASICTGYINNNENENENDINSENDPYNTKDIIFAKWQNKYYPAIICRSINDVCHIKYLNDHRQNVIKKCDIIFKKNLKKDDIILKKLKQNDDYEEVKLDSIKNDEFNIINEKNQFECVDCIKIAIPNITAFKILKKTVSDVSVDSLINEIRYKRNKKGTRQLVYKNYIYKLENENLNKKVEYWKCINYPKCKGRLKKCIDKIIVRKSHFAFCKPKEDEMI